MDSIDSQYAILQSVLQDMLCELELITIIYDYCRDHRVLWVVTTEVGRLQQRMFTFQPGRMLWAEESKNKVFTSFLGNLTTDSILFFQEKHKGYHEERNIPSILNYYGQPKRIPPLPDYHLPVTISKFYRPGYKNMHRPQYNSQNDKIYGIASPSNNPLQSHIFECTPDMSSWIIISRLYERLIRDKFVTFTNDNGDEMIFALQTKNQRVITFNCRTSKWEDMKSEVNSTTGASLIGFGSCVYVIGGREPKRMLKWCSVNDQLHECQSLKNGRFSASAITIEGKIHVLGGSDGNTKPNRYAQTLEIYNIETDTWSSVETMMNPLGF